MSGVEPTPNFRVFIIESPGLSDLDESRDEGHALTEALRLGGIPARYQKATRLISFEAGIAQVVQEVSENRDVVPIIHISAHGSETGLCLTDNSRIVWKTLEEWIEPINSAVDGSLLLNMSTCQGYSACNMGTGGKAPFFALVGPSDDVTWSDALTAFITFYHLVCTKQVAPQRAVDTMNEAAGLDPPVFCIKTAHQRQSEYSQLVLELLRMPSEERERLSRSLTALQESLQG